jgi:hypothetical protein
MSCPPELKFDKWMWNVLSRRPSKFHPDWMHTCCDLEVVPYSRSHGPVCEKNPQHALRMETATSLNVCDQFFWKLDRTNLMAPPRPCPKDFVLAKVKPCKIEFVFLEFFKFPQNLHSNLNIFGSMWWISMKFATRVQWPLSRGGSKFHDDPTHRARAIAVFLHDTVAKIAIFSNFGPCLEAHKYGSTWSIFLKIFRGTLEGVYQHISEFQKNPSNRTEWVWVWKCPFFDKKFYKILNNFWSTWSIFLKKSYVYTEVYPDQRPEFQLCRMIR